MPTFGVQGGRTQGEWSQVKENSNDLSVLGTYFISINLKAIFNKLLERELSGKGKP